MIGYNLERFANSPANLEHVTLDVMVGSPSKKQTRARDMLQSLGNLFLVRRVIYYEFERV